MSVKIQLRHDTAANWTAANPTLMLGECGFEYDTDKVKFGDGSTAWNSLPYFGGFGGTVTSVSVVTANGVSGTVATATTTPAITIILGAITPTSVNGITFSGSGFIANSGTSSLTSFTGSGTSSGTNTGNQTITLTGDVTGSGTGSFAATIANDAVTYAKIQNVTDNRILGRSAGSTGDVQEITIGTGLSLSSGTLSATVSAYTDEQAQDAIGAMIDSSLVYVDATPLLTRAALTGDVTASQGSNSTTIANDAVTFAKFQNITTARLLGRATAGSGDMEEITLGTGLSFTSTTLNVTGFSSSTLTDTHIFVGNGSNVATDVALSGDATLANTGALTLASVISAAGPIGSATVTPIITFDAKGRLTTVTSATITPAASSITGGAALTKTDDTNVTLTLGGTPTTALLVAASLTLGWTGTLSGTRGGTGVNNGSNTITLAGNLVTSGAFSLTLTTTATTNVTLPTTGTLATLAGTEAFTNKTIGNTNTITLKDTLFTLQDDGDTTKQLQFQLSGITTATTRTLTIPDANTTIVGTATTQTLSNKTLDNTNTITVKDTLFTVQDDGDATKLLAFQCSGITTGTTRTLTIPDASGTIVLNDNTATLTNKTIGITQLNGGAFTFAANNTNATANYTALTYQDPGSQTYAGTITWTGTTAPSGTLTKNYYWRQIGKEVYLTIALKYSVAGVLNTAVTMTLPSDCPAPVEWNGFGAANEKIWTGYGYIDTAATGGAPATRVVLAVNATDTGYLINATFGSQSALVAMVTVIYRTT